MKTMYANIWISGDGYIFDPDGYEEDLKKEGVEGVAGEGVAGV